MQTDYRETVIEEVIEMLGTEIRNYISEVGLKMSAVAEKANIPTNTFSAMMNDKRKITVEEYFAICKALNVTLDKFAC